MIKSRLWRLVLLFVLFYVAFLIYLLMSFNSDQQPNTLADDKRSVSSVDVLSHKINIRGVEINDSQKVFVPFLTPGKRGNYEPKEIPKNTGPGEDGEGVVLTGNDVKPGAKSVEDYGFNMVASDQISLDRRARDTRPDECKYWNYPSVENLPTASVVLVFFDEGWSTLVRTFHSVINTSPKELLKDIILVDDYSDQEHITVRLPKYIEKWNGLVKYVRTPQRVGLVEARVIGARAGAGDVIVVLDAHCECVTNWLPPLLTRIALNPKTLAVPIVDGIEWNTLRHNPAYGGTLYRGIFEWGFLYKETEIPNRERVLMKHPTEPYKSPTHAGGLLAIRKDWFFKLGAYDPNIKIWGGEQYELSFKVWMCGGQLEWVPCSHVGHIYRGPRKRSMHPRGGNLFQSHINHMRVAEIWMDDYKKYYYRRQPNHGHLNIGDVTEYKELRKNLNCSSFQWFIDNVAYDLVEKYPLPSENVVWGEMGVTMDNQQLCADTLDNTYGRPVGISGCHHQGGNQLFRINAEGEWSSTERCFVSDGELVIQQHCVQMGKWIPKGEWSYNNETKQIRSTKVYKCVTADSKRLYLDEFIQKKMFYLNSLSRCTLASVRQCFLKYSSVRTNYFLLLPETPPRIEGNDLLFTVDTFPSYNEANTSILISGALRLCTETDTEIDLHIEKLANDSLLDSINAKPTFESIFHPIEEFSVAFETAFCTIRQLSLVNKSVVKDLYSKDLNNDQNRPPLSDWQQTLVNLYLLNGKLALCHGTFVERERLRLVQGKLGQYRTNYLQKVLYATKKFTHIESDVFAVETLPFHIKQRLAIDKANPERGPWKIDLSDQTFHAMMTYCSNRELRKALFEAYYGRASPTVDRHERNVENVVEIGKRRRQISKCLGYSCYSDMILQSNMARTKENVQDFIETVRSKLKPVHDEEIRQLTNYAQSKSNKATAKDLNQLKMYDIAYWRQRQCQEQYLSSVDQLTISRHFSYEHVLKGLFTFVKHLFDVDFELTNDIIDENKWHPSVQVFKCLENDSIIGYLFVDPYARPGEKSEFVWGGTGRDLCQRLNILPIAYLNLSLHHIDGAVTLLTTEQLKELFFSFGRVLQVLLTKSQNHELSGVRNIESDALDIVPYFMLQWLYDGSILSYISEDINTKQLLKQDMFDTVFRKVNQHMITHDILRQLYLSAYDLEIHTNCTNYVDAMRKLWPLFTSIPLHNRDFHPCSFQQIYCEHDASSYYSHNWSEMIACDLFNAFKEHQNDEQIKTLGKRFRDTILARGGSISMRELFREFRGREPIYDHYIQKSLEK
ncbi:unnamed protein product [Didymodactylos carnosus]|uniref:Protein-UDP acetylgalactosaminyltransferase 7 n=1 Tax=Didymodactylos carnosus TaxID=1234261 RepID=A0A8S2D462_9BILA|nr:unnamed protein product [Didymodactylos carnosus]CAF3618690.1 unnamed protein product [Didymodactylos carnosus]